MKEKLSSSGDLVVRQDLWHESPCSNCAETPCCRNLPLSPLRLERQSDFINLIIASCYDGIFPALKKSGEWTVYLGRNCRYLNLPGGKCSIHTSPDQSLVCKSYDAHACWYTSAFSREKFSTMIPFDTGMLIWFEKKYELISRRFEIEPEWEELCASAFTYRRNIIDLTQPEPAPWNAYTLPFRKGRDEQFLFFPPYTRPVHRNHFELISFRLGFPGVYLALADNCWAFMVRTGLNRSRLDIVRSEYYPAIAHRDCSYSLDSLIKAESPFSETGEQWVILQRNNLPMLKNMTIFDDAGNVKRLPASAEVLAALKSLKPDMAA